MNNLIVPITLGVVVALNAAAPLQSAKSQDTVNARAKIKVFVLYYEHVTTHQRVRHGHHKDKSVVDSWIVELKKKGHRNFEIIIEEIDVR